MPSPIALPGLAIIGGGPAGLMAAEVARAAGVEVDLFEAKGIGRAQVPDRRQGRAQPHPSASRVPASTALWCAQR